MIRLTTEKLKQYDTNRVVEIAPKHNNELETVRFTMAEAIEPLTVPFTKKGDVYEAEIPNIFLKSFGNLTCEIITTDKKGSFHVERQAFTVRKNEMPEDYKYEENVPVVIGGGGASSLNVEWSTEYFDGGSFNVNCDYSAIVDAFFAGHTVMGYWHAEGHTKILPLVSATDSGDFLVFSSIEGSETGAVVCYWAQIAYGFQSICGCTFIVNPAPPV